MAKKEGHIVMAPFMAHGHLIPFLALARQIQQRTNLTITIVTTPLNIHYLKSSIYTTNCDKNLNFAELPFDPTQHGLPPNTESTEKVPLKDMAKLFNACLSLEAPFSSLISQLTQQEGHPPLCIISDLFLGWVTNVANTFGIKNITFTTFGAYGTLAFISIWTHLPHRKTESDEFHIPGFPQNYRFNRTKLHSNLRNADGSDSGSKFFAPQVELSMKSDGWICNTVEELENLGLQLLREYLQIPVWSVGPLIQHRHAGKEPGIDVESCIEWLNLKEQSSVLYISFGSQNTISASQMMALAEGLERSEKPFIWVIRPPVGFDTNSEFRDEWLPKGFEERMKDSEKGLLVKKWGPQLEILSHRSTGAFLSHCGWNSVLESLSNGVPIIGWPLAAEQGFNAKMLVEEFGVCLVLTQTMESVISGDEVKKVIEIVMDQREGGKGNEMRQKASEIGVQMRKVRIEEDSEVKGSSVRGIHEFVRSILSNSKSAC